ncbi:hypothetical protein Zmor_011269 [Zophobas morio]|uniref:RING-type domain-containing protein n=1 Tax=Zophobas morio TaxID=2755281 RepID=A0AA38MKA4_9CUCU|nr:hypothetical protein Zmor_011269 [Zophobas morio]
MSCCIKCKNLVVNQISCNKCGNVFHPSCLRQFKGFLGIANDITSVNSCPQCDKGAKINTSNIGTSSSSTELINLQRQISDLKDSMVNTMDHMVKAVENNLVKLFDDLRVNMKSIISESIKTEFNNWNSEISNDLRTDVKSCLSESSSSLQTEFAKLKSTFSIVCNENLVQNPKVNSVEMNLPNLLDDMCRSLKSCITDSLKSEFDGLKPAVCELREKILNNSKLATQSRPPSVINAPETPKATNIKKKVVLLSDEKGHNCVNLLKFYLKSDEYDVFSILKPEAPISVLLNTDRDSNGIISSLTVNDYLIIFGGNHEVKSGILPEMNTFTDIIKNTNTVFIGCPYFLKRPILNSLVSQLNDTLRRLAESNNNIFYLDSNNILEKQFKTINFTFKEASKRSIMKHVADGILIKETTILTNGTSSTFSRSVNPFL